ncbi:MAG: hemolysin family protein [Acidobacteriota bacterium]
MNQFLFYASAVLLFLLLLVRASLNNLSAMTLVRLADEKLRLSFFLRSYLHHRAAFQMALQFWLIALGASFLCLCGAGAYSGKLQTPGGLRLLGGLILFVVILLFTQFLASWRPIVMLKGTLPVLNAGAWIFFPLLFPLGSLFKALLARDRLNHGREEEDKEENIAALINVGQREGILEGEDSHLIQQVLEFGDTVVSEVMTPRTDMVCAEAQAPLKAVFEILAKSRHTRLPVYREQIDNIVGVAYLKDLLEPMLSGGEDAPVKEYARPVTFVPENKLIAELLKQFQQQKMQMAIVVDEYGGVDGLVTTEDLLEEIVGEIQELGELEGESLVPVDDRTVEALGRASIDDLADALDVELKDGDYNSIAGWISTALGAIPHSGESMEVEGLKVTIMAADKKRILKVRVERPAGKQEDGAGVGEKEKGNGHR